MLMSLVMVACPHVSSPRGRWQVVCSESWGRRQQVSTSSPSLSTSTCSEGSGRDWFSDNQMDLGGGNNFAVMFARQNIWNCLLSPEVWKLRHGGWDVLYEVAPEVEDGEGAAAADGGGEAEQRVVTEVEDTQLAQQGHGGCNLTEGFQY